MTAAAPALKCPYPGLRPFEPEESELFFGREIQTDELLRRLGRSRFVAVVGTSGSGKSSLVRAGLLPALVGGSLTAAGSHWRIAVMRPGSDPVASLADALDPVLRSDNAADGRSSFGRDMLEITLLRSSHGLVEAVRQAGLAQHENLLLIVDQFEELFRFRHAASKSPDAADQAAALIKLLLECLRQDEIPVHILIAMRSDFLGDCARFRDLPETINDGLYLIPRMTRDQLRAAVGAPGAMCGAPITPRLIQRLLNDLGDDPDQLPVLQHALMRSWNRWYNRGGEPQFIDIADYEGTGGMAEALTRHADEVWEELSSDAALPNKEVARKLFQCLTERGADNREVRRPTRLGEVCRIIDADLEVVKLVIERFRASDRAFLMPDRFTRLTEDSTIDISHESLIRKWERLRTWAQEEAESRAIYLRLSEAARLNQRGEAGLWRNPDLQLALDWKQRERPNDAWAQRSNSDFQLAMDFLDRSTADVQAEEERDAANRRREADAVRMDRARKRTALFLLAALVLTGVFGWLYWQNRQLLRETLAQRLAADAALLLNQEDSALTKSVLIAIESMRQMQRVGKPPLPRSDEVIRTGLRLLPKQVLTITHGDKPVNAVAFSPTGRYLATASSGNAARIIEIATRRETILRHSRPVVAAAFSADEKYLATGTEELEPGTPATAQVFFVASGNRLCEVTHGGTVHAVVFGAGGTRFATASKDRTARVFETAGCKQLFSVKHANSRNADADAGVVSVAFSPDGKHIVTGSWDGTARVTTVPAGREIARLEHDAIVYSVSVSPDGSHLATGSADGIARVFDQATSKEVWRLAHEKAVNAVAFGPGSRNVATASSDGTARILSVDTGKEVCRLKLQEPVTRVEFYPDGRHAAIAGSDGTARVMDARTCAEVSRWPHDSHTDDLIKTISVSPDGLYLATGISRGEVRVAASTTGKELYNVPGDSTIYAAALTPDGGKLATAGADKVAKWFDVRSGKHGSSAHAGEVFDVAITPDGKTVATGGEGGEIRVLAVETGAVKAIPASDKLNVSALALSRDGRLVAAGYGFPSDRPGKGKRFARVFEVASGIDRFRLESDADWLSIAFSPDDRLVVIGGGDKAVRLHEANTGKQIWSYAHPEQVVAVAFSGDGRRVAAGGADGTLQVLDHDGREVSRYNHPESIYKVMFSADGKYVATACKDKVARVIEVSTGKETSSIRHAEPVILVSFNSGSPGVLATFAGRSLNEHRLVAGDLLNGACALVPRNLTISEWHQYIGGAKYEKICPNLPGPATPAP